MHIVLQSCHDKAMRASILGISWFWFVGATLLAQFAPYVKNVLIAEASVVTLLLAVFSIGVGLGSYACNKLLRGNLQTTHVPLAAIGMSVFGIALYFAGGHIGGDYGTKGEMQSLATFLSTPTSWGVLLAVGGLAFCGGIYIVPLYAMLQHRSPPAHQARIIAANNVLNALFMVISAALILLLSRSLDIPQIFLCLALANGLVAIYICFLLPNALKQSLLQVMARFT